jgi:predicted dithiol-disulfide oxidoreductase (DUF899 family)
MAHETIDGTYRQTNLPNESAEYLAKREVLRLAEIDLRNQREKVAELRRQLPPGPMVDDYELLEGPALLDEGDAPVKKVRLSELFTAPDRALVVYQFMYGKRQTTPCPMCTSWIDSFNGVAHHLAQNIDLAVVAAAELPALRAHARQRGWNKLRLLSAGNSRFKYDLGSEDEIKTRRFPFLRATRTEPSATSTAFTRGSPTTSTRAASTSTTRSGTCSI